MYRTLQFFKFPVFAAAPRRDLVLNGVLLKNKQKHPLNSQIWKEKNKNCIIFVPPRVKVAVIFV